MSSHPDINRIHPKWMKDFRVHSWEELQELGTQNIEALIAFKHKELISTQAHVSKVEEYIEILEGKSGVDISEMAQHYTNPLIPRESLTRSFPGNPLEPTRPIDINRKEGSTTYNNCGWCDKALPTLVRSEYMVRGSCSVLAYSSGEYGGRGVHTEGCLLTSMTSDEIGEIVESLIIKKNKVNQLILSEKEVIREMSTTAKKAEDKPPFSRLRKHDHFNVDDKVVCYLEDGGKEYTQSGFVEATVLEAFGHHDGYVNFVTDEPFHTDEYLDGRGGSCKYNDRRIMLKPEFDFLTTHPTYARVWISSLEIQPLTPQFERALLGE